MSGQVTSPTVHASALLVGARAVLIRGPSGAGKSRLALELIELAGLGRLRFARLIGDEISGGHAFDKHVIKRGEFPGVTTRRQFAGLIEDAVINGESRVLSGGRTAYWSDGTVVIRNPGAPDGGTAFRPANGHDYYLRLQ